LQRQLYQSRFSRLNVEVMHVQNLVLGDDDHENDRRFIASIPGSGDLAAYGHSDKDAVAHITVLACQYVRATVDSPFRRGIISPKYRTTTDPRRSGAR